MSQIITYKEGCYSQIKLDSGERITLSCAEGGATIFKMRFFGVVPDSKIAEWKLKDLSRFMFLFGGAQPNQTPFNFTVQKLATFDSIEQLRKFITQEPGIFDIARQKQLTKRMREAEALAGVNPGDIPDEVFRIVGEELGQSKVDNTMQAKAAVLTAGDPELREGVYILLRAKQMMYERTGQGNDRRSGRRHRATSRQATNKVTFPNHRLESGKRDAVRLLS
jgi:hypothetical protein